MFWWLIPIAIWLAAGLVLGKEVQRVDNAFEKSGLCFAILLLYFLTWLPLLVFTVCLNKLIFRHVWSKGYSTLDTWLTKNFEV
jgi:hypothetical protein